MKNLGKALDLLQQVRDMGVSSVSYGDVDPVLAGARRELEALTQAGIDVLIEQVETVTVVKPKSKRGGARPHPKKSKQEPYQFAEPHR